MSYSWYVADLHRKEFRVEGTNFTWNILPMYYLALEAIGRKVKKGENFQLQFTGAACNEISPIFIRMVAEMERRPDVYRQLNPVNGWGSYEEALTDLKLMRDTCIKYPTGIFHLC